MITRNIIEKNISSHFVKFIGTNNCSNANTLFSLCTKSYVEFIKLTEEQKTKMCEQYYRGYPDTKINQNYKVVEIEYCDYSCANFIKDLSTLSVIEMEKYLDIFFFQIIFSIVSIKSIYPYFTHNDLFIRNILGTKEKDNGNYYIYEYNKKKYYVPQKNFFPKINDFGLTNLNDEFKNVKLYKSEFKDIFCIVYDVYNGGNLGGMSLSELCKNNSEKINFIKKYFGNYFNVDVIDEYKAKSQSFIDWNWSITLDTDFIKSIEMKKPSELLDNYFYNIFKKIYQNV